MVAVKGLALEVAGVTKSFPSKSGSIIILDSVNLTLRPGEIVAISGRSGVGKSTLLRIIAGLDGPTTGSIHIFEQPVRGPHPAMGYVIQDYSRALLPWLTVGRNVALPLRARGVPKIQSRERVSEILRRVGLQGSEELFPWQLSGGMQQRVAIARALVVAPQLLLLDEPFASVDAQTRFELEDLVLDIAREDAMAVLLVTHDVDEALYMADRVIVMAGSPATNTAEYPIELSRPRSQVETRATPKFLELRGQLYSVLLSPQGDLS